MSKMTETDVLPKGTLPDGRVLASVEGRGAAGQIGVLCHYSFGAMAVPYEMVEAYWLLQIDAFEDYKPKKATQKDAFMCSCSQENVGIWYSLDKSLIEEYEKATGTKVRVEYQSMPTKDGKNEYVLARRIWVVDADEEITPSQPNVARLKLDRAGDRVEVVPFDDYKSTAIMQDIEKLINVEYQRQKDIVNRNKHAQAFYRMQEDVGMVPFGFSGGCVFVPMDAVETVATFARYIKTVAVNFRETGHLTGMLVQPVYNEQEMKDEVIRNVQLKVENQYNDLLEETLAYLEKQEAGDDKALQRIEEAISLKVERAGRLGDLKEKYEQLLQTKINISTAKRELPTQVGGRVVAALEQLNRILGGK